MDQSPSPLFLGSLQEASFPVGIFPFVLCTLSFCMLGSFLKWNQINRKEKIHQHKRFHILKALGEKDTQFFCIFRFQQSNPLHKTSISQTQYWIWGIQQEYSHIRVLLHTGLEDKQPQWGCKFRWNWADRICWCKLGRNLCMDQRYCRWMIRWSMCS